jgi:hypothetical protein
MSPSRGNPGQFYVRAKLAHEAGIIQNWGNGPLPLAEARSFAERQAQMILNDPYERTTLVDLNAPWRSRPASEGQLKMLSWYNIHAPQGITSGEASKLIDAHKASIEHNKAAKLARQVERQVVQV